MVLEMKKLNSKRGKLDFSGAGEINATKKNSKKGRKKRREHGYTNANRVWALLTARWNIAPNPNPKE
jgi:hypothetical protein